MDRAIALLSGGLKSAVMLAVERERYDVIAMHVETGCPTTAAERAAFDRLCEHHGVTERVSMELSYLAELSPHPLFEPKAFAQTGDADLARSLVYVPGLVPALLDVALQCALRHGARRILVGACESPFADTQITPAAPDQQREFYQIYNDLLAAIAPDTTSIVVETPLIDLSYTEIVKLGHRADAAFDCTWSCLRSPCTPCGRCPGCRTRCLAFIQAGLVDPVGETARRK